MGCNIFNNQKDIDKFTKEWDEVTDSLKQKGLSVKVEIEVPTTEEIIGEKIESLTSLIDEQKSNCKDTYNIGIYNGLVLARSVLTGETPKYYEMEENK